MIALDALGPDGAYHARARETVTDVAGEPVAELSLVPKVFVSRAVSALRAAAPLPVARRKAALLRAADEFAGSSFGGLGFEEYLRVVARVSGIPVSVARDAAENVVVALRRAAASADAGRPSGAVASPPPGAGAVAAWVRRGEVFGVHAAGNHPAPHSLWPEALALGYRVAVRPSRREPFTPHRLVLALRAAGFADAHVALLPTDHAAAEELLRAADLGLVYGGDDVVERFAGDPAVLTQGPGRSKIVVTADTDWREHLDVVVDSVLGQGGVSCLNTTTVLVEGDPRPLAEALAERLAQAPVLPPEDEKAVLPVQPAPVAEGLARHLSAQAAGATPLLADVPAPLPDGGVALRPAVHLLDRADAPQATLELPFPCVWVTPYPGDPALLSGSLVVTALTADESLIQTLLDDPTIANLHIGDTPTWWVDPGLPHDDYLTTHLSRTKTFTRT